MSFEKSGGVKRRAEDDLEPEQRLSKRFDLLNLGTFCATFAFRYLLIGYIEHNGKLWMNPHDAINPPNHAAGPPPRSQRPADDLMDVEESKARIYIHNLDAELAEVEDVPEETRLIFISDIEKKFTKIPKQILRTGEPAQTPYPLYDQPSTGGELILYTTPQSLTTAPEHDSVRRAILESRARSMLQQEADRARGVDTSGLQAAGTNHGDGGDLEGSEEAMELG